MSASSGHPGSIKQPVCQRVTDILTNENRALRLRLTAKSQHDTMEAAGCHRSVSRRQIICPRCEFTWSGSGHYSPDTRSVILDVREFLGISINQLIRS